MDSFFRISFFNEITRNYNEEYDYIKSKKKK